MFQDWQEQKAREQTLRRKARKSQPKLPLQQPPPQPESFARVAWKPTPITSGAAPGSQTVGALSVGVRVIVHERSTEHGALRVRIALEDSESTLSPYDREWKSVKKEMPEMLGWSDCAPLLPVKEAARYGLRPSPDVAEWLATLDDEKRAVESAWLTHLDGERFHVLRQHGTEPPNTGKFTHHFLPGMYHCAGCSALLYTSEHKVDCDCGWASFCDAAPNALTRLPGKVLAGKPDERKVEILCATCRGHIGHVFKGRADAPGGTGERHCVNSASVTFHGSTDRWRSGGDPTLAGAAPATAPPLDLSNPMAC